MIGPVEVVFLAMALLMVAGVSYLWERARRLEASLKESTATERNAAAKNTPANRFRYSPHQEPVNNTMNPSATNTWYQFIDILLTDKRAIWSFLTLTAAWFLVILSYFNLPNEWFYFTQGVTCTLCMVCLTLPTPKEALR